jgi:hypothetical protein
MTNYRNNSRNWGRNTYTSAKRNTRNLSGGHYGISRAVCDFLKPRLHELLGFHVCVHYYRKEDGTNWIKVSEEPYDPVKDFEHEHQLLSPSAPLAHGFARLLTPHKQVELRGLLGEAEKIVEAHDLLKNAYHHMGGNMNYRNTRNGRNSRESRKQRNTRKRHNTYKTHNCNY